MAGLEKQVRDIHARLLNVEMKVPMLPDEIAYVSDLVKKIDLMALK